MTGAKNLSMALALTAAFAHAPVPPSGTVRGAAPRNPVQQEAAAVKPWSFTLLAFNPMNAQIGSSEDIDSDGLTTVDEESIYHTNPLLPDSDGDGFNDGEEIKNGYSPLRNNKQKLRQIDSDNDGLWDDWEIALGTHLNNPDTDGDGYKDGEEVMNGYDPRSRDQQKIPKRIEVNLKNQSLQYFFGETKLDEFKISSGLPKTPTPTGSFTVIKKRPTVHYAGPGYDFPNTKWNLMFKEGRRYNFYVHGAYWHNDFGKPKSHGCVNVPYKYEVMGRLYDWADVGTEVKIN